MQQRSGNLRKCKNPKRTLRTCDRHLQPKRGCNTQTYDSPQMRCNLCLCRKRPKQSLKRTCIAAAGPNNATMRNQMRLLFKPKHNTPNSKLCTVQSNFENDAPLLISLCCKGMKKMNMKRTKPTLRNQMHILEFDSCRHTCNCNSCAKHEAWEQTHRQFSKTLLQKKTCTKPQLHTGTLHRKQNNNDFIKLNCCGN